jgi:predicted nucleic acid-binding protein
MRFAASAEGNPQLSLDALIKQASEVLDAIAMLPLDPAVLIAAGALQEPTMRALDAIHVAAALDLSPVDAFVSYDERQSAAARLGGLRTLAPAPPEITEGVQPGSAQSARRRAARPTAADPRPPS